MPASLTGLFDRFLRQASGRIRDLSSRAWRRYESDVQTGIAAFGQLLWLAGSRTADLKAVRQHLSDSDRPWDHSLVRALEHEGVLLRDADGSRRPNDVAAVYDALAGHIIADALIGKFGGHGFDEWIKGPDTLAKLFGDYPARHPLAEDTVKALAGLLPRRLYRRQLWTSLEEPFRRMALYEASHLEGEYLDSQTVAELMALCRQIPVRRDTRDLFSRLWITRAAEAHPLNATFLDRVLREMPMPARDLRWSEWLREQHTAVINDLTALANAWRDRRRSGLREQLRARWVMWTLTSTVRPLRDHATHALYWYGCADPEGLFELALEALSINDPYVPERMLAACYGVAMSLWSDPDGDRLRSHLPSFANALVSGVFAPGAIGGTRHVLTRDYALGVIELAQLVDPQCLPVDSRSWREPPFNHLPIPFRSAEDISAAHTADAEHAIHMDFGNYTLGRLIPGRGNYDFKNREYIDVRKQIEARIVDLGYAAANFISIDREIGERSWRAESREELAADRYGKKYSWIAYFEMYGLRSDRRQLGEDSERERTSDVDIDPSFPAEPRAWERPPFVDPYPGAPLSACAWLAKGPKPEVRQFLEINESETGDEGPWVLLHGYLEQTAKRDGRRIFTFVNGLLISPARLTTLAAAFDHVEFPGNSAIPDPQSHYYLYAGEIPWSRHYKNVSRLTAKAPRDLGRAFGYFDGRRWQPGIPVEVPFRRFSWESYHSALNQVSGIDVLAPALCDNLKLTARQCEWDLFDGVGRRATLYREFKAEGDTFGSNWLYIRADLLTRYLTRTRQRLLWLVWGERGFEARTAISMRDAEDDLFLGREYIHRTIFEWGPNGVTLLNGALTSGAGAARAGVKPKHDAHQSTKGRRSQPPGTRRRR
jgi:hypothetical protein